MVKILITTIQVKLVPLGRHYMPSGIYAKQHVFGAAYATRTWISIGGVQDRDTLIEQSADYSNRTFTGNMYLVLLWTYGIFPKLPAPMHTMKCIG